MLPAHRPFRDQWVWEMPNRSKTPRTATKLLLEDVRIQFSDWLEDADAYDVNGMVIWHTHPGGHVGPSSEDMKLAVPGLMFLVVALKDNEAFPTYYRAHEEATHGQ